MSRPLTPATNQPSSRSLLLPLLLMLLASHASAAWKEKVLYSFQGLPDGAYPSGSVVFDKSGNLYGATTDGGAKDCPGIAQCGIVFELQAPVQKGGAWSERVLYVFRGKNSNDGETPAGGLIFDHDGNLYGTTAYGGRGSCILLGTRVGCGVVYQLTAPKTNAGSWTVKVIYSFMGDKDGYFPWGDLTLDKNGDLYGATQYGGGKGTTCDPLYQSCGTVFKLSHSKTIDGKWTEKVLHSFAGGTDGANPNGGLVLDAEGVIYGSTHIGGYNCPQFQGVGCGTVFKLTPLKDGSWMEQILHRFTDGDDGAAPTGGLIFDGPSILYGTASTGGSGNGFGVVFQLARARQNDNWTERVLRTFQGGNDGRNPSGPITFDSDGNLYGTTNADGIYFGGTLFRMTAAPGASETANWQFALLYSFKGPPDGKFPATRLTIKHGNIYGTTANGGTGQSCENGCGTVFQAKP